MNINRINFTGIYLYKCKEPKRNNFKNTLERYYEHNLKEMKHKAKTEIETDYIDNEYAFKLFPIDNDKLLLLTGPDSIDYNLVNTASLNSKAAKQSFIDKAVTIDMVG